MTEIRRIGRRTGSMDALMALAARKGIDRREFLRRMAGGGAFMLAGPSLLAACGGAGGESKELFVDNWILYIDTTEDSPDGTSTKDAFEAETGIKVTYTEGVNSNEEWFGKYQAQLAAGQPTGFDIVVLTDYMAAKMIRLDYVEKFDHANVPNMANLAGALKSPGFDPNRDYTLPWQSGFTGIGYDIDQTGSEITGFDFLTDPALKGKIGALNGYTDTIGLLMLWEGKDPATATVDEILASVDTLAKLVADGQIRQVYGNDYIDALINGDLAACIAWSGDIVANQEDYPNLRFSFPETGSMIWTDNMLIPKGATNKANAEKWMDFYYRPEVAAELSYWVWYVSPVIGAQEAMADIDPEFVDQPLIFPDEATLAQSHIFRALDEEEEKTVNEAFAAATGV